jgi:hypothetical protein
MERVGGKVRKRRNKNERQIERERGKVTQRLRKSLEKRKRSEKEGK